MRYNKGIIKNEKGSIAILMAFIIVVILGFTALVVDFGMTFVEKSRLDRAIDASALAGAQDLIFSGDAAAATARSYLTLNDIDPALATITIEDGGRGIRVIANEKVPHFFAQVIGVRESTIRSASKAIIGPASSVTGGLRPLALEDFPYVYGDPITLKEGAGDGYHGNYGAVSLDTAGAANFKEHLLNGYTGTLSIGDWIMTEPGNMVGAVSTLRQDLAGDTSTFANYDNSSKRLWTIPVVTTMVLNGREEIQIVGFAQFFVEDVRNRSGNAEISGRFIRFVTSGSIDMNAEDKGVYAVKLSQ